MVKPMNTLNYCVFCGNRGVTKEHIWANWLKAYIPRNFRDSQHTNSLSFGYPDHSSIIADKTRGRLNGPGDPHSEKLKVLCGSCNNGWGSLLQRRTQPFLIPLISGDLSELSVLATQTLSAWIAMFVSVVEFSHPSTVAVTASERSHLMKTGSAPKTFHIWIGLHDGDPKMLGVFNHFGLTGGGPLIVPPSGAIAQNTFPSQSTAFSVGKLFCLCYSSSTQPIPLWASEINRYPILKIWPEDPTHFPVQLRQMSPDEADHLSRAFVPPLFRKDMRPLWDHKHKPYRVT